MAQVRHLFVQTNERPFSALLVTGFSQNSPKP
jgi:hypothetical protein